MKKILFIGVNYNSYDALQLFVDSVNRAALKAVGIMQVDIMIADNSAELQDIDNTSFQNIHVRQYVTAENLGYLGGAKYILKQLTQTVLEQYDYMAISNVDITIDESFFTNLAKFDTNNIGWIAPSILSQKEGKDRNPKILNRPSKRHMQIAKMIYIHPLVYKLYVRLFYRNRPAPKITTDQIYAGHGSFMLFTQPKVIQEFIHNFKPFLFCEEHFFAEELRKRSLSVEYHPELIIHDKDHISTSAMPSRFYCRYNREAIQFIINTYFS
ncbi:MAG: hypothetical protein IJ581_04425 [Paludibacteraceae bacterium]|nr:hypothetical protein [Paludibacteraceae bacterium]